MQRDFSIGTEHYVLVPIKCIEQSNISDVLDNIHDNTHYVMYDYNIMTEKLFLLSNERRKTLYENCKCVNVSYRVPMILSPEMLYFYQIYHLLTSNQCQEKLF